MPSNSITAVAGLAGALALAAGATVAGVSPVRAERSPRPAVPGEDKRSEGRTENDRRVLALEQGQHPASAEPARAAAADDEIPAPPPTFKAGGVTVDEHLGGRVPLDAKFRTHDGAVVTLGEVLRGELPAILTFNYSDCPMLCSVQLNGLTAALPAVGQPGPSPARTGPTPTPAGVVPAGAAPAGGGDARDVVFRVGQQFRIVTIDLEPTETLDKVRAMRKRYIERLPEDQRAAAEGSGQAAGSLGSVTRGAGWTFLVAATPGDDAAIRRVADAVGFRYAYIEDRAEWAHPAALIFLSAAGVVTRYLYGIEYDPAVMRESIYKAGVAEPASAVGFMLRCYHFDPAANSHARAGVLALRFGAAGFVVLLVTALAILHFMRRGKAAPHGAT